MPSTPLPHLLWLIPAIPLLGALINGIFGKKYLKEPGAGWLAVLAVLLSFVFSLMAFFSLVSLAPAARGEGIVDVLAPWMHMGRFQIDFSLTLDPLSAVMILVVTGV